MAYTVQQKRLVDRVCEVLVQQRANLRSTALALKSELDAYDCAQQVLDKAASLSETMGSVLDKLLTNQAEIIAAATLVGVTDFVSRYQELDAGRNAINTATVGNIGTRLQAIVDALPAETVY